MAALVEGRPEAKDIVPHLPDAEVEDMRDVGMGSVTFLRSGSAARRFGRQLRSATCIDVDGVAVSITVNLDQNGNLFELDFFKGDFSPLKRFPWPSELTLD